MARTLVLGIRHQSGMAKESGKPYDLRPSVIIATQMRSVENERLKVKAAGLEGVGVECTPDVFQQLTSIPGAKYPVFAELGFEIIPTREGSTARVISANVAA